MKRNPVRLWFWLHVMDVTAAVLDVSRRLHLWAVGRASENEDWGDPSEWPAQTNGAPF